MTENEKLSTGSYVFDSLLNGGYDKNIITTVYGPAGTGKTTLCLLSSLAVAKSGKKVIFVDTEGGFSIERIKQIDSNFKEYISNIIILSPTTFDEQRKDIETLKAMITGRSNVALVVVDTISMLYRIEAGRADFKKTNNELGMQIADLSIVARKKQIPVLLTNQVYSDFEVKDAVKMVGGDILRYSSKCLIELKKQKSMRQAIIKKHRSIEENKSIFFEIVDKGFKEADIESK